MFKKKNIAKEGEIENFFNKLFSPTNYHLLSFQIFFSTPARFVSSRSQSEHDLIFFWLNLPPRVRQDIEATNDTLSRDYKPSESSFLALGRNLPLPPSAVLTCVPCSQGHAFLPKKNLSCLLIVTFFHPFPPFHHRCTRETIEGWDGEKGRGQWIHLKREYDYSYSSRGKIFLRIYRRKFVPLRRNLPSLKETEVRRWRRSRKKARVLS